MISTNLSREKRIYKALQQAQKEGECIAMKINVASLVEQLKDISIHPPRGKSYSLS